MTDPFLEKPDTAAVVGSDDERDETMSRVQETPTGGDTATSAAEQMRQTLSNKRVCPYCGHQTAHGSEPCPRCTMEDTPSTRQATKTRIGPWYVLQSRNPAAPGMKYATLLALINKGHVTPRSIVRGPTTHQMWRYAAHVRGISREFGLCFSCGGSIDRGSGICPHCQRSQDPPADPDVLIETRAVAQPQPPQAAQEQFNEPPTSYAQRMRELNKQRVTGEPEKRIDTNLPVPARSKGDLARRSAGGRVVSAMELAAALQDDPNHADVASPRWRAMKVIALLLLVAVIGAGGFFYFMPEYRAPALTWVNDTKASIQDKWNSMQWEGTKAPVAKPADPAPVARQAPMPIPAPDVEPAPAPEVAVKPPAAQMAAAPVAPTPTVETPPAAPEIKAPTAPAAVDPSAALDQARTLWRQAIDAEARQDFSGATKLYEQIKRLPSDAWPAGLQLRLDYALKQSSQTSTSP